MTRISRRHYAELYGPTTGDRVRLADTNLIIEIEKDYAIYGDEVVFGGGKSIRDGMGQSAVATNTDGALDLVITNVIVMDPLLVIGAGTEVIAGEHLIATPSGVDSHVHMIAPQQIYDALSNGITTVIGGGTGPATATARTTSVSFATSPN